MVATSVSDTQTGTRITNPQRLRLLRLGWIAAALLIVGLFVLALPNEYGVIRDSQRWGLGYEQTLHELGLTRDFLAVFVVGLEIALGVYMTAIGVFIFQR